ncbi:hypothetical protein [Palleronia pelagia]|uniref:hypothetical protein n=1 Tax=Palleronia pelagia TaxID=387096 RepID=UPI0011135528|nr:hypothetical protein [Palleronia pelagia]
MEDGVDPAIFERVFDFYASNKHNFNAERDPMELLDSLGNGSAVYIEGPNKELVAASLTFRHSARLTEMGGTRVTLNGFGLQKPMKWYQAVSDHLFRPPEDMYFAVVTKGNIGSKKNILRCGFEQIDISSDFLFDLGIVSTPDELSNKEIFKFERDNLGEVCCQLLLLNENPRLSNKHGEEILLRVEGKLCRHTGLRKILQRLCSDTKPKTI